MSERRVWTVVGVALALVAAAWLATSLRRPPQADARPVDRQPFLPALRARMQADGGGVDRIEIERGARRSVLERRGDAWVAPEKGDYPLDQAKVEDVLRGLAGLQREQALTSDPQRFTELGLAWPAPADAPGRDAATRVRVLAQGSPVCDVVLGKTKYSPPSVYARRSDESQTWRCAGEARLEPDAVRLMDPVLLTLPSDAASAVEWGDASARRGEGGGWVAEGAIDESRRAEAARLLPELFTRLEFDDVRPVATPPTAAEQSIVARVGDRSVTVELLPAEPTPAAAGASAAPAGARWFRVLVGEPEPGLGAMAASAEAVAALEAAKPRIAGREFRLPAWRAGRLAALRGPAAAAPP